VRVAGEAWQAELSGGGELGPGQRVRVERVEGLKLFVTRLPQEDNPPPNESAPKGA
jgi:membrane protein implicated in regulation of membrane protease activity